MDYVALVKDSQLSDDAKVNIERWLTEDKYNEYLSELHALIYAEEWQKLEDAFFKVLAFGTGGKRGTTGIGSNRINRVAVGEIMQALSEYLHEIYPDSKDISVAIAYDCRLTSLEFAEYAAQVCAANRVKALLYPEARSTPQLSFTLRNHKTTAGIVISASHNPSADNGVKVYWSDGGQVASPFDRELLDRCMSVATIKVMPLDQAKNDGLVVMLNEQDDKAYQDAVLAQTLTSGRSAVVAYSPLHGTGITSVYPVLKQAGFDVRLYEPQANMDGNFTNVTNNISNPEVPAANDKVSAYMLEKEADMAVTNDPDADRLAILVNHRGSSVQLTGNQTSALLADYILFTRQANGTLDGRQFISKTIVTTELVAALCEKYAVELKGNLLVGFKYISELIHLDVDKGDKEFLLGVEESYGALVGEYCRDKDGAGAALLMAEYASVLKEQNKTLIDRLNELFVEHGYFYEDLVNVPFPGAQGFANMKALTHRLRTDSPVEISGMKVTKVRDYISGEEIEGRSEDVLRLELSDDGRNRITVRPSGTEPKLKLYVQCYESSSGDLVADEMACKARAKAMLDFVHSFVG